MLRAVIIEVNEVAAIITRIQLFIPSILCMLNPEINSTWNEFYYGLKIIIPKSVFKIGFCNDG